MDNGYKAPQWDINAAIDDSLAEKQTYVIFEQHKQFVETQAALLSVDLFEQPRIDREREEYRMLKYLEGIFGTYQEQAYLLDPCLEELARPAIERLKGYVEAQVKEPERMPPFTRLRILSDLIHQYTKFRGYKAIIRFFPHEVTDLSMLLSYINLRTDDLHESANRWSLRYVILLWLSLVSVIPFDLAQLDEPGNVGKTAHDIEEFGKKNLDKAGLERDSAAVLLSRFYMRKDTSSRFPHFVEWATGIFKQPNDAFSIIGILQVVAEVAKSGPLHLIKGQEGDLMALISLIDDMDALKRNTLVRKYRSKVLARVGLRLLPHAANAGRRRKGKTLEGQVILPSQVAFDEMEVPEAVEDILQHLFDTVQDKDTIVRWSASKGIARIAENLPDDFSTQILETLLGLYEIHSVAGATLYDLPAIAEATWHGASLACAEMARRNLIPESHMGKLVEWLSKALYFDIRKGAHSIGSNVRDAAAYVLWALARTQDIPTLAPHATALANHLVSVAIYDREVHIRRAASAAFQEHVGRTSLFPHGIDVLGKTDFYSVSSRKTSFTVAAPEVARHEEYRSSLLHHVLNVVLRHWDSSMRELGAQSLRRLCLLDLGGMVNEALPKILPLIDSLDATDVHGGLLALSELGMAFRESIEDPAKRDKELQKLLGCLARVSETPLTTPRNHLVTTAACSLVAITLTKEDSEIRGLETPVWVKVIEVGIKHRLESVQDAAAEAAGAYSRLTDVSSFVIRVVNELSKGPPYHSQSLAKILSSLDYNKNKGVFPLAVATLLSSLEPSARVTIETRRSWLQTLPAICRTVIPQSIELLPAEMMDTFFSELLNGLENYTIDERGDVGSWARIASIQGLTCISGLLIDTADAIPHADGYLPPQRYLTIVASILKQGVERLDNVRHEVGKNLIPLLRSSLASELWSLPEFERLDELFVRERGEWTDAAWLFPRAVKLLDLSPFRQGILDGAINSISSKTDSTSKEMSRALVGYVKTLSLTEEGDNYDLLTFLDDLLGRIRANAGSNKVVLPIFQTFHLLLEEDCLTSVADDEGGLKRLKSLISLTTRHAGKWKSVQRIHEAMKIFVNLLVIPQLRTSSLHLIREYLAHPFPKVRYETAEYFYLQIVGADYGVDDTTGIEAILLETRWTTISIEEAEAASNSIVSLFNESS